MFIRGIMKGFVNTPQFKAMEKAKLDECELDKKRFIKEYCEMLNVPNAKYLESGDYNSLLLKLRDIDFYYDKIISGWAVQHFHKEIHKDHRFYGWSMKKFTMYDRGGQNPNGIYNGYDYNYYHFTVDDNLALTEMQRNEAKKAFKKAKRDDATWGEFKAYGFMLLNENLGDYTYKLPV